MNMDINEKLDKIIGLLEVVIERQQEQDERAQELREAVADLGLPGSSYSIFTPEED